MPQNSVSTLQISIHFHGDLSDLLDRKSRRTGEVTLSIARRTSVKDAIESQGVPHVEIGMIAVQGIPCEWAKLITTEERVDVWGIADVEDLSHSWRVDQPDPHSFRFMLDVHLGRLATYLRLLGFDAAYDSIDPGDERLAARAQSESRILLSCDRGLLMRNQVHHGTLLRSRNSIEQTREILERYHLHKQTAPFTRCLACNGTLEVTEFAKIRDRIPPRVYRRCGDDPDHYRVCGDCGRIYWEGTHTARMRRLLAEWGIPG